MQLIKRGIYFLFDGEELVYIGQAKTSIFRRISDHIADRWKKFDTWEYYECSYDTNVLNRLEEYLIRKFKPKYNTQHICITDEPVEVEGKAHALWLLYAHIRSFEERENLIPTFNPPASKPEFKCYCFQCKWRNGAYASDNHRTYKCPMYYSANDYDSCSRAEPK